MQRTRCELVRFTLTLLGALVVAIVCQASGHEGSKESKDVAIEAIDAFIEQQKIDKSTPNWKGELTKPPKVEFDPSHSYFWHLDTNVGNVKIKLLADVAPMHVSSLIYLTQLGFYDDVVFHRVITGFMAQGGDPMGSGRGGPGYKYDGEYDPKVKHDKPGTLSAANTGRRGTDGSQFFLTFAATPWLDGKHTVYGEVTEGMGTVKELEKYGSRQGTTSKKLLIEKASITVE